MIELAESVEIWTLYAGPKPPPGPFMILASGSVALALAFSLSSKEDFRPPDLCNA
jgi:hypothetical protein